MGLMMITHDLAVVADMADRIVVMRNGKIVEQGETQSLLQNMQHPYTKMLFAASDHQVLLPTPPAPEALLEVQGVCRDYKLPRTRLFEPQKSFRAVDDVSFAIERGERLGLVGEEARRRVGKTLRPLGRHRRRRDLGGSFRRRFRRRRRRGRVDLRCRFAARLGRSVGLDASRRLGILGLERQVEEIGLRVRPAVGAHGRVSRLSTKIW